MNKIAANKNKIKQRIDELEEQSAELRKEIESEFELTKHKVSDFGKIALGIAGGLLFSAIILGGLAGRRGKKNGGNKYSSKRVHHRFKDQLTRELTSQVTDFLINIAKDKLSARLDTKEKEDNDSAVTD